mgnify:CR=1 FL=1|jgi:hypothetical protein
MKTEKPTLSPNGLIPHEDFPFEPSAAQALPPIVD